MIAPATCLADMQALLRNVVNPLAFYISCISLSVTVAISLVNECHKFPSFETVNFNMIHSLNLMNIEFP